MRQARGFSLIELLVGLGLIGVMSAMAVPLMMESSRRSSLWTGSERMGALVRQTRLRAISQNRTFRVRFNCPAVNQTRALIIQGNPLVDDAANRCSMTLPGDSETVYLPTGVTYVPDEATELRVTSRGVFSAIGDAIPLTITVSYGAATRTVTVSATGQITFSN